MVSTLIFSPRRLWRSASLTAPEDGLGDLGPAADDDEPLAEDLVQRPGHTAAAKVGQAIEDLDDPIFGQPFDLELHLDERPGRSRPSSAERC